jgi:hypothetical protein
MGGPQTASRILTLVFTDLVSSTALKTERGDFDEAFRWIRKGARLSD